MTNPTSEKKQPYNTPQFERYGNVRDLTNSLAVSSHLDGLGNAKAGGNGRTH